MKWAQRSDKLYLTVELPDAKNPQVKIDPKGKFEFSATVGPENVLYELDLHLYDKVNAEVFFFNFFDRISIKIM